MLANAIKWLKTIHDDDGGAIAAEKVLILALVSIPIVLLLFLFGQKAIKYFKGQEEQLPID